MMNDDQWYLRRAIAVARQARERGNRPFGALLVDNENGNILLEGENTQFTSADFTGHAETNLLREASQAFPPEVLSHCTIYASAEPCAMCAGAIFWSGVSRVVFALGSPRLYALEGNAPDQLLARCEDILRSGRRQVDVTGPMMEDEAAQVFNGFFGPTI